MSPASVSELDGAVTSLEAALKGRAAGPRQDPLTFGDIVDPFIAHVIYATNDMIAQHPALLRRFFKGWYETSLLPMRTRRRPSNSRSV